MSIGFFVGVRWMPDSWQMSDWNSANSSSLISVTDCAEPELRAARADVTAPQASPTSPPAV